MAEQTRCQTPDAQYHIGVSSSGVKVGVDFPESIDMSSDDAELIEANLHNAVELVLAPLFISDGGDMTEREFSERERNRLAQEGHALPDGSYPMPDCDAVRRARQSYGRAPESHRPALVKKINQRNRELGCGDEEFTPDG